MSDNVEISLDRPKDALLEPDKKSSKEPAMELPSRRRRIGIRIGLAFLFLLVLLLIAVAVLWVNRNLVMEEFLRRQIAAQGFDAELTVDEITDSQARFRNVVVSQNGRFIFSADKIQASYLWPDVQSGEVLSLNLEGAHLALSLDETGRVNNDWLPESKGGSSISFPSIGVTLKDSSAKLSTPYGLIEVAGDINARAVDDIELDVSVHAGELNYLGDMFVMADKGGYFKGQLSGKQLHIEQGAMEFEALSIGKANIFSQAPDTISLVASGTLSLPGYVQADPNAQMAGYKYDGQLSLIGMELSHPSLEAQAAGGDFKGTAQYDADRNAIDLNGLLEFQASTASYLSAADKPYAKAQGLSLSYNGKIGHQVDQKSLLLSGKLDFDAQDLGLIYRAEARLLAERLAIHKTLSATPVAQNFHADITAQIARLFQGVQTRARISVDHNSAGYSLGLAETLQLSGNGQNSLSISSSHGRPFLTFNAAEKMLGLNADLILSGERSIDVKQFTLSGTSRDGLGFSSVKSVSAMVSTASEWRARGARLAPFTADLTYAKTGSSTHLAVAANIDFDGPLLGSDFTGLRANGQLRRESQGLDSALFYEPDMAIQIDNIVTRTGWSAHNVSAQLDSGAPLLSQRGGASEQRLTNLSLSQLSAIVNDETGEQSFVVTAEKAHITGQERARSEHWDAQLHGFNIRSETTPGPGSELKSSDMTLNLSRGGLVEEQIGQPWRYKLQTQALSANLAQLKLRDLGVSLSGQDSDFTANYQGGTVQIDGVDLPALPMAGQANYRAGVLSGTAKTAMPRASRFPIHAKYSYENGVGNADLDIPEFIFSPGTIQPAELSPALRGKIAQVSGLASAKVKLGYQAGQGVSSSGRVTLTDMDIGTLVGPFTGVNTTLSLDSLVPLRSLGTQTIMMTGFNPGLPLGEGKVSFDVVEGGIALREARWPLNTGSIYIEPTKWDTTGRVNRIIVRVENVSLDELVAQFGNENFSVTGQVNGTLPIMVDGVTVLVEGGNLTVKEGGMIRVRTEGLDAAGASNDTAKIAIDALKEFEYKELSLDIDGPLDGDMAVGAVFGGKNADVLGGADFLFRINIEGELVNIAKSFAKNAKVEEFLRVLDEELR